MILSATTASTAETQQSPTLLVVDDNADIRYVLRAHLERAGYRIREAEGGEEALGELDRGGIDGVLLDLRMPKIDGFEVLERMRNDPELRTVPVITVSAHADGRSIERLTRKGVRGHVDKPFAAADLLEAVARVVGEAGK